MVKGKRRGEDIGDKKEIKRKSN